ncbi:MAG: IS66 family transposase [Methylocella sp.]
MHDAYEIPEELGACQSLLVELQRQLDELLAHRDEADKTSEELHSTVESLRRERDELKLTIQLLLQRLYGHRSEKLKEGLGQQHLDFGDGPEAATAAADAANERETVLIQRRKKRQKDRTPRSEQFPPHIERRLELIDIAPAEREGMIKIGEDVTERLEMERVKLWVRRIIRPKYARPGVPSAGIKQQPPPMALVEGGRFGFTFVTDVLFNKYVMHLPLYRQQDLYSQTGWVPSRSTLCQIVSSAAELLQPLADHMRLKVLLTDLIATDDTTVTLLTPGEGKGSLTSHLWLYSSPEAEPYNVFDFTESREAEPGPDKFLKLFRGTLLADAYSGYVRLDAKTEERIVHAACHAHARRDFYELRTHNPRLVNQVLALYQLLYDVEDRARELSADERKGLRQAESKSLMQRLRSILDGDEAAKVLPRSKLGEALGYVRNQWTALSRFLDDGRIPIDNNAVERDLRAVAIGRKNWMFIGSYDAGLRTATILTVVSSAARHCLDIWAYLVDVLERLAIRAAAPPLGTEDLDLLLPDRWKSIHPEAVRNFREKERLDVATAKKERRAERRMRGSLHAGSP